MDLLTDDIVADFMDHKNDARPYTQPTNVNDNLKRTTRIRQGCPCGTDHRLPRPGQT